MRKTKAVQMRSVNLCTFHSRRLQNNRDLKIRGREGQDGNGSGRGKLSRVQLGRQKQNAQDVYFRKGRRRQ